MNRSGGRFHFDPAAELARIRGAGILPSTVPKVPTAEPVEAETVGTIGTVGRGVISETDAPTRANAPSGGAVIDASDRFGKRRFVHG